MSVWLREVASAVVKIRALLGETRKQPERISQLLTSISACLESFWDTNEPLHILSDCLLRDEFISLIGTGRVLALIAEADSLVHVCRIPQVNTYWAADGRKFIEWLADGIVVVLLAAEKSQNANSIAGLARLCGKALYLGHADLFVDIWLIRNVSRGDDQIASAGKLIAALSTVDQRRVMDCCLRLLTTKYLPERADKHQDQAMFVSNSKLLRSGCALLHWLSFLTTELGDYLRDWLATAPIISSNVLRAGIAAIGGPRRIELLQRIFLLYNEKLFIKHGAASKQECKSLKRIKEASANRVEAATQVLLLTCGYVHRENPMELFVLARSGHYTSGVSRHLASTSERIRFLGMVTASTISGLVDSEGLRVNFELHEFEQADLEWYQGLIDTEDEPSPTIDFTGAGVIRSSTKFGHSQDMVLPSTTSLHPITPPKIVEIQDSFNDKRDDLLERYQKPVSDKEDSDDDATLVRRDRPKAPVYIRDLILAIRDTEDHDRHMIALKAAPALIRKKADFGSELKDGSVELSNLLVGLSDHFDMEGFEESRMQSMLALLVSRPSEAGPHFAKYAYSEEYSLGQRILVLEVLALGAQELVSPHTQNKPRRVEPIEGLPAHVHEMYNEWRAGSTIARFPHGDSSVHNGASQPQSKSKRDIRMVVTESLYLPILAMWQSGKHSDRRPVSRGMLPTLVKTLVLVFDACARNNVLLAELTTQTWDHLLTIRTIALSEMAVLENLLFGLLTLLNVNNDKRRIALENGRQLLESQEWVQMIMSRLSGLSEEEARCSALAGSFLVASQDIGRTYQRLLLGLVLE